MGSSRGFTLDKSPADFASFCTAFKFCYFLFYSFNCSFVFYSVALAFLWGLTWFLRWGLTSIKPSVVVNSRVLPSDRSLTITMLVLVPLFVLFVLPSYRKLTWLPGYEGHTGSKLLGFPFYTKSPAFTLLIFRRVAASKYVFYSVALAFL